jgi:hypothetical protein
MPRFVWLSGPECGDMGVTTAFDREWRVDKPVEVDEETAVRVRRNRFFREVKAKAAPPAAEPVAEAEEPAEEATKAELWALAEERGVEIDRRWGIARLREALEL